MTNSVSINSDGSVTSSNAPRHASSDDFQSSGMTARSGIGSRTVSDASRISDDEIIQIDGMDIKMGMARDMGLIDAHTPDEGLNKGSATPRSPEAPQGTGHQDYDSTVSELSAQVEAGQMKHSEATEYSTALGQVALAGLTVSEVSDTIDGLKDGTINPMDLDQNQRDIAENLESTVTNAATASAQLELGDQGFNRLAEIARGAAKFNDILRQYASMRALGKADHTWTEFLVEAEAWSQGER